METESDRARELGAKGAQRQFAVVAGADGFAHGRGSRGLQAGKQNAGLDLRAGNRRGVVDGLERTAVDGERRVAVGEREARAHGFKRLANALHGAARERGVADEREAALLRREQVRRSCAWSSRSCRSRADRAGGVTRPATPVISIESAPVRFTFAPSASMQARVEAQSAPVEKLVKRDVPSAKRAEHGVAMADGFVAGQAQAADDVARGADEAFLCGGGQAGSGVICGQFESIE